MSNEQKLREIIRKLLNRARALDDCGAGYESWQSDELMAEIAEAEQALATTEPEPAGMPKLPEPDSYEFQHEETGNTMFVDRQQVEWGFEKNNPRLQKIAGAYTTSQMRAYGEQCWKAGYKHGAWGDKPAVNQQLTTAAPVDEQGLPPLPEPDGYRFSSKSISKIDVWPHGGNWFKLFSEEKLKAYARAALQSSADVRDAERLDFIEKHARCDPKMDGQHVWWPTTFKHALKGPTLRDAIDAAIDAAMAKGVKG